MSSQRHLKCKDSTNTVKNINKKVIPAEPKDRAISSTSAHLQTKLSETSKLPVRIGRKPPKFQISNGVLHFKGLSLADAKRIDASVNTESEMQPAKSVIAKAVDAEISVDTVADALNVESIVTSDAVVTAAAKKLIPGEADITTEAQKHIPNDDQALNVDPETNEGPSGDLMLVKEDADLPKAHRLLEKKVTFELYTKNLAKLGGSDINETVREIGQKLISDEVLQHYSYKGQRGKKRFKDYDNITKLVVAATVESMKRRYFEIHGKVKIDSDDEKKRLHGAVEKYFTSEYIKEAERRVKRSMK